MLVSNLTSILICVVTVLISGFSFVFSLLVWLKLILLCFAACAQGLIFTLSNLSGEVQPFLPNRMSFKNKFHPPLS